MRGEVNACRVKPLFALISLALGEVLKISNYPDRVCLFWFLR